MKGLRRYLLVALLPVCVLLAAPVRPALILALGGEVRLATVPVDPRDLFRGDFVTLRFAVENVPLASFDLPSGEGALAGTGGKSPTDWERAVAVKDWYVPLRRHESGVFQPVGARTVPPDEGPYLRGTLRSSYDGASSGGLLDFGPGLERFYLRENTGRSLEDASRRGRIEAIVKVWRGMPAIVSLDIRP